MKKCILCCKPKHLSKFIGKRSSNCQKCDICRDRLSMQNKQKYKSKLRLINKQNLIDKYIPLYGKTRICTSCNIYRDIELFIGNQTKLLKTCDKCRTRHKRSRLKNIEKVKIRQNEWKAQNKTRISMYNKCYRNGEDWENVKITNNITNSTIKQSPFRKKHYISCTSSS